jgi:membrane protease YdiL (CAAX protease family)
MKFHYNDIFWNGKSGCFLLILMVLIPSGLFLRSGNLLLLGLSISMILSWIGLTLQKKKWSVVGLTKPLTVKRTLLIAFFSLIILITAGYFLRHYITLLNHQQPDLEAFKGIEGNPSGLLIGLCIVWIFGAFGEEMLFRGFLFNTICNLFPSRSNKNITWGVSLLITSVFVGIGHTYQGITGMILTGFMGFFFGLVYLKSKKNLWSSILTHGLYDTVALVLVFLGIHLDNILRF